MNGKDITYPEELKRAHFERMLKQMVKDRKQVERLMARAVRKAQVQAPDDK